MSRFGIQVRSTSPIIKGKPKPLSSQSPHLSVYEAGGRVDAERARTQKGKQNLRQEKRRIVRELKK